MFPKLEGLDDLARRDGVDIRPTLVRVLTDLYVQKNAHSAEEERHYTELVLRMIDSVDLQTRTAVAAKLAVYAGAPPAVIRRLARDVIEVAEAVLRKSDTLTVAELDAIVRDFGAAHASAIAARSVPVPAAPPSVTVEPQAPPAPQRPEAATTEATSAVSLADLFFSADAGARRVLLTSLGNIDTETPPAVRPIETIRALEAAALGRERGTFIHLLQNALGLTHEQAERIVADRSGEPLLVAAKALAMPAVVLQRILMFIDPAIGESVQRVFDLASFYERLSSDAAHMIVASLRGREPARARRPAHRAMYYDDETRGRRGAGLRRTGAAAEPQTPSKIDPLVRQRTM
jgi:hypothetical protein